MDRWSRRWQSGEVNKEHVRSILDEVSARRDWPAGSAEQLSGDFYGACMDESRVNQLGIGPVRTLLDEISGAQSRSDVQRLIGRLHAIGVGVGFETYADQDLHDPTQIVAHLYASGLGLPDRDYYLKPEDRFVEARAKYHEHVAKMFALAGSTPEAADAAAASVFEMEKRLAEATLDNVASRDPNQLDHKTRFDGLAEMAPDFDWDRYFDAARLPRNDLNVTEPKFLKAFNQELAKAPIEQWRNYHGLACPEDICRLPVRAIRRAGLRLLRQVPQRRDRDEAALEALRGSDRRPARRSARARLRREVFLAGSQGAHGGHGQEHPAGDG